MIIRCTKKAQKRLHLKPADLAEVPDTENPTEWYCNVAVLERRPYFLLTHRLTLFAFWMPLKGNAGRVRFGKKVREYARRNLKNIGIDDVENVPVLDDESDHFAKTADRAVLGSMNDYINQTKYQVADRDGLDKTPLEVFSRYLNEVPMGAIDMDYPEERMRDLIKD